MKEVESRIADIDDKLYRPLENWRIHKVKNGKMYYDTDKERVYLSKEEAEKVKNTKNAFILYLDKNED